MNEIEKKEIEEMARINCNRTYKNCSDCIEESKKILSNVKLKDCECYCFAEAVYNAGYRKVEDYKKELIKLKEENERLKVGKTIVLFIDEQEVKKKIDKTIKYDVDKIKQQAIKEFAKCLYDKYGKYCSEYYYPEIIELTHKELDYLLKEYGIGEE